MNAPSIEAFRLGLYREHLEEAAFLRVRRDALRAGPDGMDGVADVEARLDAHVDALRIGRDLARRHCEAALQDADADTRFVVVLLGCVEGDARLVSAAIATLAPDDADGARALGDAMKLAWPAQWSGFLLGALRGAAPALRPVLLDVAGYRRLDCVAAALDALGAHPREALRALGRVRAGAAIEAVREHLGHADPTVRWQATIAALRLGDRGVTARARAALSADPVAPLALGLAGDADAVAPLVAAASGDAAGPQAIAALGLLGDGAAWAGLLAALDRPALAPAAANALVLVAGGGPMETVLVPDAPSPDAMTDDERRAWSAGGPPPTRSDGRPYGTRQVRPSTRRADWLRWAGERGLAPAVGRRLRRGGPWGPAQAVDALEWGWVHPQLHALAAEETAIRLGRDDGFEPDMLIAEQARRRAALRRWADAQPAAADGGWAIAGRPG